MFALVVPHRDYVHARLPFVLPMAVAAARRRLIDEDLARRIVALGALLLEHLANEEPFLAAQGATSASTWVGSGMLGDHLMIATSLDEILDAVSRWSAPVTELERRLGGELADLGDHVHAQIALEETLVAARLAA